MKVLLGITGGVAAVVTQKIIASLLEAGHEVAVVTTGSSSYFIKPADIMKASPSVKVWTDADEWPGTHYEKGDPVHHILLREWADVILIAPLTANTLAKVANGIADNLLTSVMRAWNLERPVIIAPAMNTLMWKHPVTAVHLETLESWYQYFVVVPPVEKKLACGDTGIGALANVADIVATINHSKWL